MKPKFSFLNIILIIWLLLNIIIIIYQGNRPIVKIISNEEKVKNNNFISMMLESEAGTGMYEESKDASFVQEGYVFNAKLSKCENGSKISFEDGKVKVIADKSDKCYVYLDKDNIASLCRGQNMSECFTQNYQKDSALIYHDGKADYDGMENYNLEAEDLSYRYTGKRETVNNFVCFNSDDDNCNIENLYQIIGFFLNNDNQYEMKLIKADYTTIDQTGGEGIGDYAQTITSNPLSTYRLENTHFKNKATYFWNGAQETGGTGTNNWLESRLNKNNLNDFYYNTYLKEKWRKLIMFHDWNITGGSWSEIAVSNAKAVFNKELTKTNPQFYSNYIGLMYVSDYMYAALPNNWSKVTSGADNADYRSAIEENWLYLGLFEWTITHNNTSTSHSFFVSSSGSIGHPNSVSDTINNLIRPVFYLNSQTKLLKGNGTQLNPYRLAMD